jgi:SulP family sulfate permease
VAGAAGALATPGEWSVAALGIAVAVGAITLTARRINPLVPGALLGSLAAVLLVRWSSLDVPVVGDIPSGFPVPSLDLPWSQLPALLLPGLVIALVGFAEPASIARKYAGADRSAWDPDREFVGQGLANLGRARGPGGAGSSPAPASPPSCRSRTSSPGCRTPRSRAW